MNDHIPPLQHDVLPCPRQIISAPAIDFEGGKGGRYLRYRSGETGQHGLHLSHRRPHIALGDHLPFQIETVGLRAERDGEVIDL